MPGHRANLTAPIQRFTEDFDGSVIDVEQVVN
jgi:hypothetical protein